MLRAKKSCLPVSHTLQAYISGLALLIPIERGLSISPYSLLHQKPQHMCLQHNEDIEWSGHPHAPCCTSIFPVDFMMISLEV